MAQPARPPSRAPPKTTREGARTTLLERYANKIKGVLSCFDRVIIHGTLPGLSYAAGMTAYLKAHGVRIFDYPKWAEQWRDQLRTHFETLAAAEGLTIEFIKKVKAFRKEDRIQQILATRGTHPGLVHIFSAMEPCPSYAASENDAAAKVGEIVFVGMGKLLAHPCTR
jgi:hypothetical protein